MLLPCQDNAQLYCTKKPGRSYTGSPDQLLRAHKYRFFTVPHPHEADNEGFAWSAKAAWKFMQLSGSKFSIKDVENNLRSQAPGQRAQAPRPLRNA